MSKAFSSLINKKKNKQIEPIIDTAEIAYEILETNTGFETLKIKRSKDTDKFILATIFSCAKVDEKIFESLESILKIHSPHADAMILDISKIETVSPNIIKKNTKMFKNIDKISNIKRVGIIIPTHHKAIKLTFEAIVTMIKPKQGETKVFDKESEAIEFALGVC